MPLMHKAVWHLLNHLEFVARRHVHKDLNIALDRVVKIEKRRAREVQCQNVTSIKLFR
jgi:hypothetical protein